MFLRSKGCVYLLGPFLFDACFWHSGHLWMHLLCLAFWGGSHLLLSVLLDHPSKKKRRFCFSSSIWNSSLIKNILIERHNTLKIYINMSWEMWCIRLWIVQGRAQTKERSSNLTWQQNQPMKSCQTQHINSAGAEGRQSSPSILCTSCWSWASFPTKGQNPKRFHLVILTLLVGPSQLVASTASPQADKWGLHCFYCPQYVVCCAVNAQWQEKFLLKLMQGIAEVSKRPQKQMWGIWFSLLVNSYTED